MAPKKPSSTPPGAPTIAPVIWRFFVISLLVLLLSVGASNLNFSWLTPIAMNAMSTPPLPEQLQIRDLGKDVIAPLTALTLLALAIQFLPRTRLSLALANGMLLTIATRYIIWRLITINTAHPVSFILSAAIYGYELIYVILLVLEFIPSLSYDPAKRSRQADRLMQRPEQAAIPVDIFITTYNETSRHLRRCIYACKAQRHPYTTIHVLDDGNRAEIRALAQELGVNYITRSSNEHRKAGNLNNALKQTKAELIAVLDCDFIPYRNFLDRTLGFFIDESVAIVQTPQHYFMPDFHARNLGVEGLVPSDVDMFYGYQQVIRDNYNAVICVGTSYVIRRKALESIGGYVTTCIIEDYQTSSRLIVNGWRLIYLNEILSIGETPSLFRDYLEQRLRWLQGNIQILLPKSQLGVLRSRLSGWQKMFYLTHYASNFIPAGRLLFLFIPLISLYLGNQLIVAPVDAYLAYALPFVLLLHTIPSWSSGHHVNQIWNEIYETITCAPWTIRLLTILRQPFAVHGSTVTPKGNRLARTSFDLQTGGHLIVHLVFFLLFFLLRFGLPILSPELDLYPANSEGQEIMILWNIYNLIIVTAAFLCCLEKPYRRTSERIPAQFIVRLSLDDNAYSCWGITTDISETGACLQITSRRPELDRLRPKSRLQINLIDRDLELSGTIINTTRIGQERPELRLEFDDLSHDQEARLLAQIYDPDNAVLQPRKLSVFAAVLLLLDSLLSRNALIQPLQSSPGIPADRSGGGAKRA